MTDLALDGIKDVVHERIGTLEQELQALSAQGAETQDTEDDESAKMDKTINSAVESRMLLSINSELTTLRQNLAWLESPEGGYCRQCGEVIPAARLKAVPATRFCVQCAQ